MIIVSQKLIALSPLLILGLTTLILMLCISWRRSHFINVVITIIGFTLSLLSLWIVAQNCPLEITLLMCVDRYSILYTGLALIIGLATSILSYDWMKSDLDTRDELYLLVLFATEGGILLSCANHLAALFLGIELISLPLFGMIGYAFYKKYSLEASIKYMLLSAAASSFLLFGMALIYAITENLSFIKIAQTINENMLSQPVLLAGLGMMFVGICFKLSLVPFHLWTPDVYQGASAPASVFLATTGKFAIFSAIARLFYYVPLTYSEIVRLVIAFIALVSILSGNLMALNQNSIKRVLAYSSISQLGYLLIGLISIQSDKLAIETINIYLISYAFTSLGAFGIISIMSSLYSDEDTDSLHFYRGLFWRNPLIALAMTVMMLSLAGIPMTIGFIGKFYMILISINSQLIWFMPAIIVSSIIGLFYCLRILVILYILSPNNLYCGINLNWKLTTGEVVVLLSSLLVLFFGLCPQPLIKLVQLTQPTL